MCLCRGFSHYNLDKIASGGRLAPRVAESSTGVWMQMWTAECEAKEWKGNIYLDAVNLPFTKFSWANLLTILKSLDKQVKQDVISVKPTELDPWWSNHKIVWRFYLNRVNWPFARTSSPHTCPWSTSLFPGWKRGGHVETWEKGKILDMLRSLGEGYWDNGFPDDCFVGNKDKAVETPFCFKFGCKFAINLLISHFHQHFNAQFH